MPEVDVTSADTGTLDVQENLAHCQISTPLHNLQAGLCFSNPQIMLRVCIDTDICLSRRNCCCAHLAALCLKSNDWEEKMSEEGISMIYQRNSASRKERQQEESVSCPYCGAYLYVGVRGTQRVVPLYPKTSPRAPPGD